MRIKDAVRISVTLRPEQLDYLRDASDRFDLSVSHIARLAVDLWLHTHTSDAARSRSEQDALEAESGAVDPFQADLEGK